MTIIFQISLIINQGMHVLHVQFVCTCISNYDDGHNIMVRGKLILRQNQCSILVDNLIMLHSWTCELIDTILCTCVWLTSLKL